MQCGMIGAVLLLASLPLPPVAKDKAKADPDKVVAGLVKAINAANAKDLHALLSPKGQQDLPIAALEAVLRELRTKYGKLPDELPGGQTDGKWRVYRTPAEKQPCVLKAAVDDDGRISGFQFRPAFLDPLPAGPVALSEVERRMQEAVERSLYVYRLPSISLALVKGDRIVWAKAFGYQNAAKAVPADPETVYVTGSIFKVVVATAVMQLVDEGKLDLDGPVNSHLKAFQIKNPFDKEVPLTLRHLLSHHGGVPNGAATVPLWRRDLPTPLEELVKKRVEVKNKPGEHMEYSNLAFALLGYLVGQASESSVEAAFQKRLFNPLGMTHTAFEPTPAMTENLALPYHSSSDGKRLDVAARVRFDVYPAGDVYSTPSDVAHFLIAHLNGGKFGDKVVLSPKSAEEMGKLQFAKPEDKSGAGLGWMVTTKDRRLLWHNGAVPGFYTYMAIDPQAHVGVVLFTNRFSALEAAFGTFADPLRDLGSLAIELLDRLEAPREAPKK